MEPAVTEEGHWTGCIVTDPVFEVVAAVEVEMVVVEEVEIRRVLVGMVKVVFEEVVFEDDEFVMAFGELKPAAKK